MQGAVLRDTVGGGEAGEAEKQSNCASAQTVDALPTMMLDPSRLLDPCPVDATLRGGVPSGSANGQDMCCYNICGPD